jgi:hypothetical protein
LKLDDVLVEGKRTSMSINVTNVSYLIVDSVEQNIQFELNLMAGRDGEVIKVAATSHEVALIVEWHDFLEGIIFTKSYRIVGEWVDEDLNWAE